MKKLFDYLRNSTSRRPIMAASIFIWSSILFFRTWGRSIDSDDFILLNSTFTMSWHEFFTPYGGYLQFYQRGMTELGLSVSLSHYFMVAYVISLSIWTISTLIIQTSFEKYFDSFWYGFVAACCFVLMPVTNFMQVGSIVTGREALVVALAVVIGTKNYPKKRVWFLLLIVYSLFVALSSPIAWLLSFVLIGSRFLFRKKLLSVERWLVTTLLISGFIQLVIYATVKTDKYTSGHRVKTLTFKQILYGFEWMAHSFLPSKLRGSFISGFSNQLSVLRYALFLLILVAIFNIFFRLLRSEASYKNREMWFRMIASGFGLTFAAFSLSRISNYHYILLGCFTLYTFFAWGFMELFKVKDNLLRIEKLILVSVLFVLVLGALTAIRPAHGDRYFWNGAKFTNGFVRWRYNVESSRLACAYLDLDAVTIPFSNPDYPFLFPCSELEKRVKLTRID